MTLKKKYKEQLLKIIDKYIPNCTVYLFGSRAIDAERPGSDIDLAVDAGKIIPHKKILKILIDIDDTTIPMSVDIVDLHNVAEDFKKEIISKGIVWKM